MKSKLCKICNKSFFYSNNHELYCSKECKKKKPKFLHNKICEECKKEFKGVKSRKFCSISCSTKASQERLHLMQQARRKYKPIDGLSRQAVFHRNNPEKREKEREYSKHQRITVLNFLGGKCIRCGYDKDYRALCLDHINSDGFLHRKIIGHRLYRYYYKHLEEAKKILQVLCANCNMIKSIENYEHNRSRRVHK